MANDAHVRNRPSAGGPQRHGDWHLGHVIGLLLNEAPYSGTYTADHERPDGHERSHVSFGRGPKWRVEPVGRDAPDISDGVTRNFLSGTTIAEHGPADANLPLEVHAAFPRYALIWGRVPGDEWRFLEGVEHTDNTLTAHLERIRTPADTARISVDIDTGLMLSMETPVFSLRVRDPQITSVPPEVFQPPTS